MIHLTSENYSEVVKTPGIVLVDFYAEWCGPCKALNPVLEALEKEYEGRAIIAKVNVDQQSELSREMGITAVPKIFVYQNSKDGLKQVKTGLVGMQTKNKILQAFDALEQEMLRA